MIIRIEENGHRFTIPLPLRLGLNGITIRMIGRCIEKYTDISLEEESLKILAKELINAKRTFKKLVLVDVSSSDGKNKVKITL